MKTRTGFVSNSSSSSFVIVGTPLTNDIKNRMDEVLPKKVDEDDYEWYDRFEEHTGLSVLYVEYGEGAHIVGKVLADIGSDGGYLENKSYSCGDIQTIISKVIKNLGGGDIEPKLMLGTRPS